MPNNFPKVDRITNCEKIQYSDTGLVEKVGISDNRSHSQQHPQKCDRTKLLNYFDFYPIVLKFKPPTVRTSI